MPIIIQPSRKKSSEQKYLEQITDTVMTVIVHLDELVPYLEGETDPTRRREFSKAISNVRNWLEEQNDRARFFGLGINFRTDAKRKEKHRQKVLKQG